MTAGPTNMVASSDEITPSWLTSVLGAPIQAVDTSPVGTGQIGTTFRVHITPEDEQSYGGPRSLLAKLPAVDEASRTMLAGAYRGEVNFYRELAPSVAITVPQCFYAEAAAEDAPDNGAFTLLLEDLAPAEQGDQIAGCSPEAVRAAAINLAGLHGPRWSDPSLLDVGWLTRNGPDDAALLAELYGPATEIFVDGLAHLLDADTVDTLRGCVPVSERWSLARQDERYAIVHGDYRLDNLLFSPHRPGEEPVVTAVDWQTLSIGLPARDLAYLIATSMEPEPRRAHEREIVEAYRAEVVRLGVTDYSAEQAFDDYRFALLQAPLVAVFGCAYGARTDRGDAMFAAMVTRACAAMRDHETLSLAAH